ncbi:HAD family hydrolase [Corynebacterium kalidii]|uniref:HAD-IB family hydrolase n=1 Tax=Corynebacterium kalidii TaxID=2931982 RepID=A0A9X2AZK6_9CORY|nr:HAD-IB family hydrolase [Corynebacterium kalidii]MCJ7858928.1 HAD-IB family hydrolase [Corynebacterium kalidii]
MPPGGPREPDDAHADNTPVADLVETVSTDPGVDPSTVLAVFDLDKTIIDTSASMAYRKPLAERGLITTTDMLRMLVMLGNYMISGHDDNSMNTTRDTLVSMVRGRSHDDLADVAHGALQDVIVPFIYSEARTLIDRHHALGHHVAIITASARVLVTPVADELGADHLIATELAVDDDGLFTGDVPFFCKGPAKVEGLRQLADRQGYDLTASYAYSDSATDLPLLEAVGHPTVINPDRALRREATARDWPVARFARTEPLVSLPENTGAIAGTSAAVALVGTVAAGLLVWLRGRDEE